MSRLTDPVGPGDTGRVPQYNNLRREAGASSYVMPYASTPPDNVVNIAQGIFYIGQGFQLPPLRVEFDGDSQAITAPTTNPRIDLIQLQADGDVIYTQGSENVSPVPPVVENFLFPVCFVFNRPGQTMILDEEDGVNGYIIDTRPNMAWPVPQLARMFAGRVSSTGNPTGSIGVPDGWTTARTNDPGQYQVTHNLGNPYTVVLTNENLGIVQLTAVNASNFTYETFNTSFELANHQVSFIVLRA